MRIRERRSLLALPAIAIAGGLMLANVAESSPGAVEVSSNTPDVLEDVRARGFVRCGIRSPLALGISADIKGSGLEPGGMEGELCKAVAAAVFNAKPRERKGNGRGNYQLVPVTISTRFAALRDGITDVNFRTSNYSPGRDGAGQNVDFVEPWKYGGQGFMSLLPAVRPFTTIAELLSFFDANPDEIICAVGSNKTTLDAAGFNPAQTVDDADPGNYGVLCNTRSNDPLIMNGVRLEAGFTLDQSPTLAVVVRSLPFSPTVKEDQPRWRSVIANVMYGLHAATQYGVGQGDAGTGNTLVQLQHLFGETVSSTSSLRPGKTAGELLGLESDWAITMINEVGNYGEIWKREIEDQLGVPAAPLNQPDRDADQNPTGGLHHVPDLSPN